ncbi:galactose-1-phosphate uridylyltransferase [Streptomyces koyangensis]|uniref:galactose-1-phosphate uridylyltransferase n=1 Tax=Streptomyces koyangensis TaxID=188770 RepID=UPI003C2DD007
MSLLSPARSPHRALDPLSYRTVFIADGRAGRPQNGDDDCPFCPGGREAPAPYGAPYAFANRWPALGEDRCEVVVHGGHESGFATMEPAQVRQVVDLWALRSRVMAGREGVRAVLVFENRGAAAGATVAHPHSQVFGLPLVPDLLRSRTQPADCPLCRAAGEDRQVSRSPGWRTEVPSAPPSPYTVQLVPERHVGTLAALDPDERDGLAGALRDAVARLDQLFGEPMPYHLWVREDTASAAGGGDHLHVVISALLRSPGRLRILGAAEMATGLLFTPLSPRNAAAALRDAS